VIEDVSDSDFAEAWRSCSLCCSEFALQPEDSDTTQTTSNLLFKVFGQGKGMQPYQQWKLREHRV